MERKILIIRRSSCIRYAEVSLQGHLFCSDGERLTWFFTEEKPDGTEVSTACRTFENREEHPEGVGRYERLCRMQKSLDYRQSVR